MLEASISKFSQGEHQRERRHCQGRERAYIPDFQDLQERAEGEGDDPPQPPDARILSEALQHTGPDVEPSLDPSPSPSIHTNGPAPLIQKPCNNSWS